MKTYILRKTSLLQNDFHASRENGVIYVSEVSPKDVVAGLLNAPYKNGLTYRQIFYFFAINHRTTATRPLRDKWIIKISKPVFGKNILFCGARHFSEFYHK